VAQIAGGNLQGVEQHAGSFSIELAVEQQAHDLHEGDLNGVGVFEDGQVERGTAVARFGGVDDDALLVPALVKETKTIAFERG
jgi:hypothetical protein